MEVKTNQGYCNYTCCNYNTLQLFQTIGKHKIPRYLYHFTNSYCYREILSSGALKPFTHDFFIPNKNIFFIDLGDFIKNWNKIKLEPSYSELDKLLDFVGRRDIVLLRIPTDKLNLKNLRIRSQKTAYSCEKIMSENEKILQNMKNNSKFDFRTLLHKFLKEKCGTKSFNHMTKGDDAIYSKLYQQRKEALEYFYPEEIKSDYIEKIGEIKIQDDSSLPATKEFLEFLLRNANEKNHLINL